MLKNMAKDWNDQFLFFFLSHFFFSFATLYGVQDLSSLLLLLLSRFSRVQLCATP